MRHSFIRPVKRYILQPKWITFSFSPQKNALKTEAISTASDKSVSCIHRSLFSPKIIWIIVHCVFNEDWLSSKQFLFYLHDHFMTNIEPNIIANVITGFSLQILHVWKFDWIAFISTHTSSHHDLWKISGQAGRILKEVRLDSLLFWIHTIIDFFFLEQHQCVKRQLKKSSFTQLKNRSHLLFFCIT